jgi:hypothetical protein
MDALRVRGVVFEEYDFGNAVTVVEGLADFGTARAAWSKDSEGNIFELGEAR